MLAPRRHGGSTGITNMGIMFPDHYFCRLPIMLPFEIQQGADGVEHVAVTHIPGRGISFIYASIICFRIGYQSGILHRIQKCFPHRLLHIRPVFHYAHQHINDGIFTPVIFSRSGRPTISSWIRLPWC